MSKPKVIGEGSYGCVHDPSLKCDRSFSDVNYKNKVSKILSRRDANKELVEYAAIERADPNEQFYLGVPKNCPPAQSKSNYQAVRECKKMGSNATIESTKHIHPDYHLLVMNNGGMNLSDYAKSMKYAPSTPENRKKMEMFWIECHRLFLGLSVFLKQNIIHHDLKAQNIVYNPTTNRVAFIDFGLMRPLDSKKAKVFHNNDHMNHWSYPVETFLYNKTNFSNAKYRQRKRNDLNVNIDMIYDPTFLYHVLPSTSIKHNLINRKEISKLLFYSMDVLLDTKISYNEFLDKSLFTFDLYGMSMGLMYVFLNTFHLLEGSEIDTIELFMHLYDCFRADIELRHTVDEALNEYEENVLRKIMLSDNVLFVNHVPTQMNPPSPSQINIPTLSDSIVEKSIEKQDQEIRKKTCPSDKIMNPLTGRCVKECGPNQLRDAHFKCRAVKNKTIKVKTCPEGKELNPHTNRCVKKCGLNQYRDDHFKCKTAKNKEVKVKTCLEGKELNPHTNRCVKMCGPNQERDDHFKCKTIKK